MTVSLPFVDLPYGMGRVMPEGAFSMARSKIAISLDALLLDSRKADLPAKAPNSIPCSKSPWQKKGSRRSCPSSPNTEGAERWRKPASRNGWLSR